MQLIGVVHLKSLPGSPSNTLKLDEIIIKAQQDYNTLKEGGISGVIFENFGDTPFVKDNISSKLLLICTPKLSGFSIVFMTSTAVTMLVANNHCFQPA